MQPSRGIALQTTVTVLAVLALILLGLYYFLIDPYSSRLLQFRLNDFMSAASVPGEIADAAYLLSPANGGGVYQGGALRYDEYERNGALILDVAYVASKTFKIVYEPASRRYVVMSDGRELYTSPTQLLNLFVSNDGSRVAVSERNDKTMFEAEPVGWDVVVIDPASGTTWNIDGFAAVFLDADTVLAFRSTGITAVDYEIGTEENVRDLPTTLVYPSIAQSKDGSRIAWTTLDGELKVYDVITAPRTTLAPLKETSTAEVRSRVALTDDNVYEVIVRDDGRTDIMRHAIFADETSHVRSLPSSLGSTKLIP